MAAASVLIALARPRHWIKNGLVLMPLPFAVADGAAVDAGTMALGSAGFCLITSAVYAWNDAQDAETDRLHPTKRQRPVAAGQVSQREARLLATVLLISGAALCWAAARPAALTLAAAYLALNLIYSSWGRAIALVDVTLLAAGYVLRVLFGCALLELPASGWLLLCTSMLALFLAFAKRRADLVSDLDNSLRPSLRGYSLTFLDRSIAVTSFLAVLAYAVYCSEAPVLLPGRQFVTLPFVILAVLRYLTLVRTRGEGGAPVELLCGDRILIVAVLGWIAATAWSLSF